MCYTNDYDDYDGPGLTELRRGEPLVGEAKCFECSNALPVGTLAWTWYQDVEDFLDNEARGYLDDIPDRDDPEFNVDGVYDERAYEAAFATRVEDYECDFPLASPLAICADCESRREAIHLVELHEGCAEDESWCPLGILRQDIVERGVGLRVQVAEVCPQYSHLFAPNVMKVVGDS